MATPERKVVRSIATLRQQVVEGIRSAITDLTFRPGDRLIERELCEMLGVSRTLVREALSQLGAEGLIQNIPHKGPIVAVVSVAEARGLYEVRAALEALAAKLFTERASPARRAALAQAMRALKPGRRDNPVRHFLHAKAALYDVLLQGTDNAELMSMLRLIHTRVMLLRTTTLSQPGRLPESLAEIQRMVDAIQSGDADAAADAAAHHVRQAERLAVDVLTEQEARLADSDDVTPATRVEARADRRAS